MADNKLPIVFRKKASFSISFTEKSQFSVKFLSDQKAIPIKIVNGSFKLSTTFLNSKAIIPLIFRNYKKPDDPFLIDENMNRIVFGEDRIFVKKYT